MRKPIEGKHLNEGNSAFTKMMMLPAKEGTCEQCATKHEPEQPHNAQAMFYQYYFYNETGKWPNWTDAMAHCSDKVKEFWISHLKQAGVDVEAGRVHPTKVQK